MYVPEANRDPATRGEHCVFGVDEAACHLVQTQISRGQAEEVAGIQGTQLALSVADSLVLREQQPATRATVSDPLLVWDVCRVILIEIRNQMNRPT
jgi:hypothetical protein